MIKLFSCLPWTVTQLFLFKCKSKKKTNEKEIVDLSPFLSSFSAFLYEMAVMSEQYFNGKENQNPILKSTCVYISVNSDVIMWRWCWQQLKGGSEGGMNVLLYSTSLSVASPPRQQFAGFFTSFTDVQYVGTQGAVERDLMNEWNELRLYFPSRFDCSNSKCPY